MYISKIIQQNLCSKKPALQKNEMAFVRLFVVQSLSTNFKSILGFIQISSHPYTTHLPIYKIHYTLMKDCYYRGPRMEAEICNTKPCSGLCPKKKYEESSCTGILSLFRGLKCKRYVFTKIALSKGCSINWIFEDLLLSDIES